MLAAIERQAMIEAGIEPKERALAEARYHLASADDMTEQKRGLLQSRTSSATPWSAATMVPMPRRCRRLPRPMPRTISSRCAARHSARATPDDDIIVRRLSGLDEGIDRRSRTCAASSLSAGPCQRRLESSRCAIAFAMPGSIIRTPVRQRERDRQCARADPRGRGAQRHIVGHPARWLRHATVSRPARIRCTIVPVPVPDARQRNEGARGGEWREPGTRGGWSPPLDFPTDAGRSSGSDDERFSTGGSF